MEDIVHCGYNVYEGFRLSFVSRSSRSGATFRFNFIIGKRTHIHTYIYILYLNTIGGGVKIITNELNYISKIRITLLTKYSYNKTLKIHSKILKKIQC